MPMQADIILYDLRCIAHNKKTSQSRCVGTRHQRYLRQTDNVNLAVSRLPIMGNHIMSGGIGSLSPCGFI